MTKDFGHSRNRSVSILNPFGLNGGKNTGCNPMLSVKTFDDAMRLAKAVAEVKPTAHEPSWQEASQHLIGAIILAAAKDAEGKPAAHERDKLYFDLDETPHTMLLAPSAGSKGATIEIPDRTRPLNKAR